MFISTLKSTSRIQLHRVLLAFLLIGLLRGTTQAQTLPPAYYSVGSGLYAVTAPNTSGSGSVVNAVNAADSDFSTFATLTTDLSILAAPVALRLGLTATAPAGYRAGIVLSTANSAPLASASALGTVTLRTYLTGSGAPVLRETKVVPSVLVASLLGASTLPTQLEFTSSLSFNAIEVVFSAALNVNYSSNIFYGYAVPPGIQTNASGYLSRFAAPTGSEVATRSAGGLVCVNSDILNSTNVVDYSLTNFAQLHSTASVGCNPILKAKLANVPLNGVPGGYYAGFVVGQGSILDVSLLNNLKITTYRNGVAVDSKGGSGNILYRLLAGNKMQISFATAGAFDEVEIERTGAISLLDDLEVYYAFGLEPSAFVGLNPLRSDFATPQATDYIASSPQVVSLPIVGSITLSRVDNPQNAADADMTNFAQMTMTGLGLGTNIATGFIKLKLNGSGTPLPTATKTAGTTALTGVAGNRVGMVVSTGSGLLNTAALQTMTLATYDASNNVIESIPGTQLLNVALLDGTNRSVISFLASRDFTYVGLLVASAGNVNSVTKVYYAFAQDVPLLSLQYPLPVELTSFNAKWTGSATDLRWATASEKNSSYFVAERSTSGDGGYQAVGRVAAAGSSTSSRSYQLRDAEAGALGASMLYYRLRQVDADGSETFSPVVTVAVGQQAGLAQLEVYPNPAGTAQEARLDFRNLSGGGQLSTYSETGQLVSQTLLAESAGRVALPALKAGLYYVVLRDAAGRKVAAERLVVRGR